jgi:hypothetical protein
VPGNVALEGEAVTPAGRPVTWNAIEPCVLPGVPEIWTSANAEEPAGIVTVPGCAVRVKFKGRTMNKNCVV